jgi:hypothetical protein
MFDDFEGGNDVESLCRRWNRGAGCLREANILRAEMFACVSYGLGRDVNAQHVARLAGQRSCAIAGAAPGVEHVLFLRQPRGESVTRLMLIEQVGVHLIGDDAFSGELSHSASF